jgi:hypothetical protein
MRPGRNSQHAEKHENSSGSSHGLSVNPVNVAQLGFLPQSVRSDGQKPKERPEAMGKKGAANGTKNPPCLSLSFPGVHGFEDFCTTLSAQYRHAKLAISNERRS